MDLATPALPAAGPAPQPPAGGSAAPVSRPAAAVRASFAGQSGPVEIAVAVETPVEIAFAGVPFAVMMASPADLEDFATGFCLTEGIVDEPGQIRDITVEAGPKGVRIAVALAPDCMNRHLARRRALSGRTGCGICGIEDLATLERRIPPVRPVAAVGLSAIERALAELEAGQGLHRETHAVHAAAWADRMGRVTHLREDVGRHNALDKLVGALLRAGADPTAGFVLVTSRCSFEMVDKAAAFGAGLLVAISAPTSLALDRALALGLGLVALARRDGVTVFLEPAPALS